MFFLKFHVPVYLLLAALPIACDDDASKNIAPDAHPRTQSSGPASRSAHHATASSQASAANLSTAAPNSNHSGSRHVTKSPALTGKNTATSSRTETVKTGIDAKPPASAPSTTGAQTTATGATATSATATGATATPPPGSAEAVAARVDKIYEPIKLFRARFNQKYVTKVTHTTKKSSGVVYVQRPHLLSFTYHDPNKNRVVSDGTTLKIYEHNNKQMFVRRVANTEYPGAFGFIMGQGLRPSFTFTFHRTANWEGGPVLVGKPKGKNPGYKVVIFYIDQHLLKASDPACMRRVLVVDAQNNRNRFDFLDISRPASIPAKEFRFTAPKGTTIIK